MTFPSLSLLVLAASVGIIPAISTCASAPPRVSASFRGVPLRTAMEMLFRGTGVSCEVEAGVPDASVSLRIRDLALEDAVTAIVADARKSIPGLAAWRNRKTGVWTFGIRPRSDAAAETEVPPLVSIDLRDAPLREAIQYLVAGTGYRYSIDPAVPDVPITLTLRQVPLPNAFRAVLGRARLQDSRIGWLRSGHSYTIRLHRLPQQEPILID